MIIPVGRIALEQETPLGQRIAPMLFGRKFGSRWVIGRAPDCRTTAQSTRVTAMSDTFPRGAVSIAGTATFGVGEAPAWSAMELAAKPGLLARRGCRPGVADVDGLFICLPSDLFAGLSLAEYYGIHPQFTDNNRTGGSSFVSH